MARNGYLGTLSRRLRRPPPPDEEAETDAPPELSYRSTYVLEGFLSEVRGCPAPVVVDLGPAIGSNVTFLGEEIACKLFIDDLLAHVPERPPGADGDENAWAPRLPHPDGSVDGILCWDVLDFLAPPARAALGVEMVRVLRPGGVVLMCHRVDMAARPERLVYEITGPDRLCVRRGHDAAALLERPLKHRELLLMFSGLTEVKAVLLKSRMREVLFRKARPVAALA